MAGDWRDIALEDVADELTVGYVGPMASEYVDDGVPFLRSLNIEPLRINKNDLKFITPEFHKRIQKSRLTPGDVVIVRTGKPGACSVVPDWLADANCSDLVIVRCGPQLNNRFLAYYVNTVACDHVAAHLVGAVQQHFNVGSARTLRLNLPPLAEQKAIAAVLGALDDKIECHRRMNATLEAMARALFQSWFVDAAVNGLPKGWRVGTIGDVAENARRGINPDQMKPATAYIGLEHMPRRSIALSEWGHAGKLESNKFEFRRGEILFGKLRAYFHKVGVAPLDGVCSTDILVVRPQKPEWFGFVLGHVSSIELVNHTDAASTGTKMPRSNWNDIARFEAALPPQPLAAKFTELIRPMIDRMIANIHESRTLATLRDTLLPKLLSGELRVQDAKPLGEKAAA